LHLKNADIISFNVGFICNVNIYIYRNQNIILSIIAIF